MVKRSHICLIYKAFHKKTAKKWGDLTPKQITIPKQIEDG